MGTILDCEFDMRRAQLAAAVVIIAVILIGNLGGLWLALMLWS